MCDECHLSGARSVTRAAETLAAARLGARRGRGTRGPDPAPAPRGAGGAGGPGRLFVFADEMRRSKPKACRWPRRDREQVEPGRCLGASPAGFS